MATVSPNAEVAAHVSVPSQALGSPTGTIVPVAHRSRLAQMWLPVLVMVSLFGVAVLVHAALADKLSGQTEGWLVDKGFTLNTNVFAGVGLVFLVQAIGSHAWVVRKLNTPATLNSQAAAPLTLLAVPMAVRLATTFAALAYLLITITVSRDEAVCVVLFWYIALTTLEVAAIVWAQQPKKSLAMPHPSNTSN